MGRFTWRSRLPVPADALFAWHARPGAFERLAPPWVRMEVARRTGGIQDGGELVMRIHGGPFGVTWRALHRDYVEGRQFVDEQVAGPFRRWVHTHRCIPDGPDASFLEDEIDWALPGGSVPEWLGASVARASFERMFAFRHRRTAVDLARQQAHRDGPPLRIAVSGASGLVGAQLVAFLGTAGHDVRRLVRRAPRAADEIAWDPARGTVDAAALEGSDAIVHLAGANVADGRWTDARKRAIRESRTVGTRLLAEALAGLARPPRVLLSASAIGVYGDRGDAPCAEGEPIGDGFLADVCREWEAATAPAEARGIRVVHARIGIVLAAQGGALARMLPVFRLGLGGVVGQGTQWMSWIALDDVVGALHHLLHAHDARGPVNLVAPAAATNRDFTAVLGRVLGRPTVLPVPAAMVRLAFGEMGEALLLGSTRVVPARLGELGFGFQTPALDEALRAELGLGGAKA